jgi:diacylglycerol kinase family enzyme
MLDIHLAEELALALSKLMRHSRLWADQAYQVELIVNPAAGELARPRRLKALLELVLEAEREAHTGRKHSPTIPHRLWITRSPGHATQIAEEIISQSSKQSPKNLVLSVGGDGTHLEVLSAFAAADPEARSRFALFRLPLGTGNDGAEAPDMPQALRHLLGAESITSIAAIEVRTGSGERLWSFNVASLGIDAYITDLTNKLKPVLPGNAYKTVADIATLFYERLHGVGEMVLERPGLPALRDTFIMVVLGVTGGRNYGNSIPILPGDQNFLALRTVPLLRKIALKSVIYAGKHLTVDAATAGECDKLIVHYDRRVPFQTDGESRWLEPADFPLEMKVHPDVVQVLSVGKS